MPFNTSLGGALGPYNTCNVPMDPKLCILNWFYSDLVSCCQAQKDSTINGAWDIPDGSRAEGTRTLHEQVR